LRLARSEILNTTVVAYPTIRSAGGRVCVVMVMHHWSLQKRHNLKNIRRPYHMCRRWYQSLSDLPVGYQVG